MKPIIHQWLRQLPRMLLLMLLAATALPITARNFTYDGITYTVISETEKTCETKAGEYNKYTKVYIAGNRVSGDIILPKHPKDGDVEFTLIGIGEKSFYSLSELSSIEIPSSVISIGASAFHNCTGLKSLVLPPSIRSVAINAFKFCTLKPLRINSAIRTPYHDPDHISKISFELGAGSLIECVYGELDIIGSPNKRAWNQYKYELKELICGVAIYPVENPDYDSDIVFTRTEVVISNGGKEISRTTIDNKTSNIIKGLEKESYYNFQVYSYDAQGSEYLIQSYTFQTESFFNVGNFLRYNSTQTSITINGTWAPSDGSFEIIDSGVYFEDEKYQFSNLPLHFVDLYPFEEYKFKVYFTLDNGQTLTNSYYPMTKGWDFGCSKDVSPTAAVLRASFTEDDAKAEDYWWTFDGQRVSNKDMTLLSLAPNTSYSPVFHIYYEGKDYTFTNSVKTKELEFTTLPPKGVSATCAIVAAETNISEVEPQVGFQWKKYDAPSSLAPSEGYAVVCNGVLEGYIKNLQSTSYYNVRPFYKDAKGKYYYGEWVTFDPSDFSFFEPTVRTYPVQEVTQNSATVRGYALSGTENIKSQGFQYWKSRAQSHGPARVPSASEIMTVNTSGQVMTATFDNLEAGATYIYRAFVETESGFTYGDEQSFTTEAVDGIGYVRPADVTITGYYTLTGVRYDSPRPGLNIVVYSDGTTKKIFVR